MAIYNLYIYAMPVANTIVLLCMHAHVGYIATAIYLRAGISRTWLCISANCISYLFAETDTLWHFMHATDFQF